MLCCLVPAGEGKAQGRIAFCPSRWATISIPPRYSRNQEQTILPEGRDCLSLLLSPFFLLNVMISTTIPLGHPHETIPLGHPHPRTRVRMLGLRCPRCHHMGAHRTQRRTYWEGLLSLLYRYPFRCEQCEARFFAFSDQRWHKQIISV